MGQSTVGEPEILVEAPGIRDQRVAFPFSDRAPVIQGIIVIPANLTLVATAVEVDDAVVGVPTAEEHENALTFTILDELHAFRQLELTGTSGRLAVDVGRIVGEEPALAFPVEG